MGIHISNTEDIDYTRFEDMSVMLFPSEIKKLIELEEYVEKIKERLYVEEDDEFCTLLDYVQTQMEKDIQAIGRSILSDVKRAYRESLKK